MSRDYVPDCWVVLELGNASQTIRKVFAGWYGGFTQGDSWKLSSGIVEAQEFDNRWEFKNHSGSLYVCYKAANRMSGYMTGIYNNWLAEAQDAGHYVVKDVSEEYVRQ